MIKIYDNRSTNETELHNIECNKFFIVDNTLYRRCWYALATFEKIVHKAETLICVRMNDGELVALSHDQIVEPIADRQIEFIVED